MRPRDSFAELRGKSSGRRRGLALLPGLALQAAALDVGQPIAINTSWDEAGYAFDACMPVASTPEAEIPEDSPVKIGSTYGGKALKVVHKGAYANLPATYEKTDAYLAAHGLKATDRSWDQWISDPGETPEEELITHIYFPLE